MAPAWRISRRAGRRLALASLGVLAGLAADLLLRHPLAILDAVPALHLLASVFAAVFFTATLALAGPLGTGPAAARGAMLGLGVAALMLWAGQSFAPVTGIFARPQSIAAAVILTALPLPFLIAAAGPGWRHYPTLFREAWSLVVRLAAAWVFVGVIWVLLWLSDALLRLVGLALLSTLSALPVVPWIVTGAAWGLALAVVDEMGDLVAPDVAVRLLRLLLPVVLGVSVLFVVALPFNGFARLFGGISAAGTLLVMALGGVGLVAIAVDESDREAARTRLIRRSAQGLALMLPLLAALAAAGVWLRVAQFGWTPGRLASALMALVALGYGIIYAFAVTRGESWLARVRRGNVAMALVVMALAALWLSPLLNAERIAARSQLARFQAGHLPLDKLEVEALRDRWGLPGRRVMARLTELARRPGQEALRARLAAASPKAPAATKEAADSALRERLKKILPLRLAAVPVGGAGTTAAGTGPDATASTVSGGVSAGGGLLADGTGTGSAGTGGAGTAGAGTGGAGTGPGGGAPGAPAKTGAAQGGAAAPAQRLARLRDKLIATSDAVDLRDWLQACQAQLPDGRPGCVLLGGAFLPGADGIQALLLARSPSGPLVSAGFALGGDGKLERRRALDLRVPGAQKADAAGLIGKVLSGDLALVPAPIRALSVGGRQFIVSP